MFLPLGILFFVLATALYLSVYIAYYTFPRKERNSPDFFFWNPEFRKKLFLLIGSAIALGIAFSGLGFLFWAAGNLP